MSSAIEALGMSLPYSSSIPAVDGEKMKECLRVGPAIRNLLEKNIRPRDILTRKAFENALRVIMVLGGKFLYWSSLTFLLYHRFKKFVMGPFYSYNSFFLF